MSEPILRTASPGDPPATQYGVPDELAARFEAFVRDSLRYRQVSTATAKWYRDSFRTFLKYLASERVSVLGANAAALIREWLATALEGTKRRPISPFTARSYWQALRAFFVYLDATDAFPNPYRALEEPIVPDTLPKALSFDQCVRVLDAARNTDWTSPFERARAVAMIATALYAGLRRKEILALRCEDVDLDAEHPTIFVEKGKGRGGGKQRVTYVNEELAHALRTYRDARRAALLEAVEFFTALPRRGVRPGERRVPTRGVKARVFRRIVERVARTAGFRFTLHALRHSFVTHLIRGGVPLTDVKELAGHRDLKTTERYTRVFDEDKQRAVAVLSFTGPRDPHRTPRGASAPRGGTPPRTRGYTA
jgi:integrase/recombinase XerD